MLIIQQTDHPRHIKLLEMTRNEDWPRNTGKPVSLRRAHPAAWHDPM